MNRLLINLWGSRVFMHSEQNERFRPFNDPFVQRVERDSHPEHAVYEVMWECPNCGWGLYTQSARTPAKFSAAEFAGQFEICPDCNHHYTSDAGMYFLGDLVRPRIFWWIDDLA